MKRCSRFELREVQTTTAKYCLQVPIIYRMAKIHNTAAPDVGEGMEQQEHSFVAGGN